MGEARMELKISVHSPEVDGTENARAIYGRERFKGDSESAVGSPGLLQHPRG
jgi:hypothetical protein